MADQKLKVSVKGTEKVLWEGEAEAVSSVNSQGPFDILPFHTNFITVVEKSTIVVRTQGERKEFSFPFSVVYAHSNIVNVYTNM